jgi:hypothetical protein
MSSSATSAKFGLGAQLILRLDLTAWPRSIFGHQFQKQRSHFSVAGSFVNTTDSLLSTRLDVGNKPVSAPSSHPNTAFGSCSDANHFPVRRLGHEKARWA